jgi:hypothetical protein
MGRDAAGRMSSRPRATHDRLAIVVHPLLVIAAVDEAVAVTVSATAERDDLACLVQAMEESGIDPSFGLTPTAR